jgi:hypothetical protein
MVASSLVLRTDTDGRVFRIAIGYPGASSRVASAVAARPKRNRFSVRFGLLLLRLDADLRACSRAAWSRAFAGSGNWAGLAAARARTGVVFGPLAAVVVDGSKSGVSCALAVIADRRGCRIARQVRDDVPREVARRLVRRAERQGDAHARGRCLAARRAPGHAARIWWLVAAAVTGFVISVTMYVAAAVRYMHRPRR